MEARAKGWMVASAAMLSLSILVAAGPVISSAIAQRAFTEPFGTIPSSGTCSDKLGVFLASQRNSNTIFVKAVRDYFEQQTGCAVEKTPVFNTSGVYSDQFFPTIESFEYSILNATPTRVGGSFGSIPAWKLITRYEIEFEAMPDWGLCKPGDAAKAIFSGDWSEPSWPAEAALTYLRNSYGTWWFDDYWSRNYGKESQYWSRYSVSYEVSQIVSDQHGPIIEVGAYLCGTNTVFQNSLNQGYHYVSAYYYLDPADLKPYNIPFYSWMGW